MGKRTTVNNFNNDSYVPCTVSSTLTQGPPATDIPSKHIAAALDWSNPSRFAEDPFFSSGPHDFSVGSIEPLSPAFAGPWKTDMLAAHWRHPDPSSYIEQPFATEAASIGNNTLLTEPAICTNGQAVAESPVTLPASNSALIPFDVGPPTLPRPVCTECNQAFGRQSDLERHAKKHLPDTKIFQCQINRCKYSSYRKDKLGEHVRRRHSAKGTP